MINALKRHWKIYCMEAVCLGLFMVSASFFATILEYPNSPVHKALPDDFLRLCLMGLAMGITIILLIHSPMGKLSGAHMNPVLTLTFYGLKKVKEWDAFYYSCFQCLGGLVGIVLMDLLIGRPFEEAPVSYVVTVPGKPGVWAAFLVEVIISLLMILMVLITSNHHRLSKYTGYIAGVFVTMYVIVSAPISGFSMNPARTLASAIPANMYPSLWIYFTAPLLGMSLGAVVFSRFNGKAICAKLLHVGHFHCIFNCGYCQHKSAKTE